MAMIELSPPLRDTLKRLGELQAGTLKIFVRGFKELLKECEEEKKTQSYGKISC